ncbi:hypothetical protein VTN77DRAFT_9308 [Rasamsonia byssochlamydoides]|uniref:uncharacterized protein n=1 Tax=Rasamsonia byssochlamydoides TaxID=89139 RepID=UPI0037423474
MTKEGCQQSATPYYSGLLTAKAVADAARSERIHPTPPSVIAPIEFIDSRLLKLSPPCACLFTPVFSIIAYQRHGNRSKIKIIKSGRASTTG